MENKPHYIPFGKFVYRTPLFSLKALKNPHFIVPAIFDEALYIASPELWREKVKRKTKNPMLEQTLYKYQMRSASRCTPFGVWAGCGVGVIGNKTNVDIYPTESCLPAARIDMHCLHALIRKLEADERIQKQLRYFPNDTIYEIGTKYRYVEYSFNHGIKEYQLSQIDRSEFVDAVLQKAKSGAIRDELARSLVTEDVSEDHALQFVEEMILNQLLNSELDANITGPIDPFHALVEKLSHFSDIEAIQNQLSEILSELEKVNTSRLGNAIGSYERLDELLEKIKDGAITKQQLQVDLFKPAFQATVSEGLVEELARILVVLDFITPKKPNANLEAFIESFSRRYEEQEVPIVEVLDSEIGIGYPSAGQLDDNELLNGLSLFSDIPPKSGDSIFRKLLLEKSGGKNVNVIMLKTEDFNIPENINISHMPHTVSVLCSILKDREAGRLFWLRSPNHSNAVSVLGRFCYLNTDIHEFVNEITEKQKTMTQAVIADFVHGGPNERGENIMLRPCLNEYEVHYNTPSSVGSEFQIPVSDLMISVRRKKIILRSRKLDRVVFVRMATFNNHTINTMPVYRFFGDLQEIEYPKQLFFYGLDLLGQYSHIPRIMLENCILTTERWKVWKEEFIGWKCRSDEELLVLAKEWRKKRRIKNRFINISGKGEGLVLDLENSVAMRVLLKELEKNQVIWLEEFPFSEQNSVVRSGKFPFANEFIFSFYKGMYDGGKT